MLEEFLDSLKRAGVQEITIKFKSSESKQNGKDDYHEMLSNLNFSTTPSKRKEVEVPPEMMTGDL